MNSPVKFWPITAWKLDGGRAWSTCDYGEKSAKLLSSLLVFLNYWLNFRVRDQFEIKMLIARGHSDINTTLSVIMSLFCCRSLCLCISLSRCLCLFILAPSPVCLPAFFTIIFSPSSRPGSFYLPTIFAKILSSSSLCLKPVVYTLNSLCCCLLT